MNALTINVWFCCTAAVMTPAKASDPNDILAQSRALRRQFTAQTVSAVSEQTPEQQEASLAEMIERVLSLQAPALREPNQTAPASRVVARASAPASVSTLFEQSDATDSPSASAAEKKPETPRDLKTDIEALLRTAGDPASVPYPMHLADVLYRADSPELAARYYDIALKTTCQEDASAYSWLLFQAANCLRHTDSAKAKQHYDALIRAYPNSVWAAAAQARLQTLRWLETNASQVDTKTAITSDDE